MNCTVDGITEEVCRLVSKLEKRDLSLDALRESILEIQAPFAVQHRCQEDSLTFEELSKRVESHPRGWLILCLAAENKELEQLQAENRTLLDSLDKHQSALDLIMKKYRLQVSQLMQTNRMEKLISTNGSRLENIAKGSTGTLHLKSDGIFSDERLVRAEPISNRGHKGGEGSSTTELTTAMLNARVSTLASMARDVCNSGDLYTTQLEAELHRLRSENAGLRELLTISSDFAVDPTDVTENTPSTDRAVPGSSSAQSALRLSDLSVLSPNQNSSNVDLHHPSKLTNLVRALDEFIPYNTAQRGRSPSDLSSGHSEDDNDDYEDDVTVADGGESSD
ncbi:Circulating cathodic antigen [Clonorchis sinensis]|uniref:Circulating cathodic antigen n=1 Tax=Clonorchis sinensis TaxID=79923 RepID=A0A8T1MEI8_CLOSI|nr:Circulating cathodic antigen [Clonorchis sinensis]